jgi:hypothetical protein
MTQLDVANNLRGYVRTHPEFQGDSVQGTLINYLIALCGTPKQ